MKTRDYILIYVNGERHEVKGEQAFWPLSDFLRYGLRRTGTKVVCAEGDCGACTALRFAPVPGADQQADFRGINTCIYPVFLADGSHLVTVEGLAEGEQLHPVQQAMIDEYGSQCGFCTPGFVMALADMFERDSPVTDQDIKNHLTGNLCRCTGYQPILNAAHKVRGAKFARIKERYDDHAITEDLKKHRQKPVFIRHQQQTFQSPVTVTDATAVLANDPQCRIYSGATDLGVRHNKAGTTAQNAVSLNLVEDLYRLERQNDVIFVGAKVSLRQLETFTEQECSVFADFMHIFASPQIKESATLVGNLMNGSPIADTLPFLFAVDAQVHCCGPQGERKISIHDLFTGYKTYSLQPGEWVKGLSFQVPKTDVFCRLYKVSQRRDLDISGVNAAIVARGTPDQVSEIKVALGGVGPTTLRLPKTEAYLQGKSFQPATVDQLEPIIRQEVTPLSDVRGTAEYRYKLAINLLRKFAHDWNATTARATP